jgi:hypothetical protein
MHSLFECASRRMFSPKFSRKFSPKFWPKFLSKLSPIVLAALLMAACQASVQQEATPKANVRQGQQDQQDLRLMVYTSDLAVPYEKLGDLSYTEPVSGENIDTDHIDGKLRTMAIARWGQQVDAIIHVTTKIGGADTTTISVAGEAVRLKGSCSGCRHNSSAAYDPNGS